LFRKQLQLGLHVQLGTGFDLLLDVAFRRGVMSHLHNCELWSELMLFNKLGNCCFQPRVDFIRDRLAQHDDSSVILPGCHSASTPGIYCAARADKRSSLSCTIASMRWITASIPRYEESMMMASSAATSGDSFRVVSRRSRCAICSITFCALAGSFSASTCFT